MTTAPPAPPQVAARTQTDPEAAARDDEASWTRVLVLLLWRTGARISEALDAGVQDIDWHAKTLRLRTLKGGSPPVRVLPVEPDFLGELGSYIASERVDGHLFRSDRFDAYRAVRRACLEAGIEPARAHPHVFRHSFAVHAVLSGVPAMVLQRWLGHKRLTTTLVYFQVTAEDTRRFREAIAW